MVRHRCRWSGVAASPAFKGDLQEGHSDQTSEEAGTTRTSEAALDASADDQAAFHHDALSSGPNALH